MHSAGIALGSNVGDRLANLRLARDRLRLLHAGAADAFRVSPIFETEPVGCEPGAKAFYNAALEIVTDLDPLALLDAAQAIERDLGRPSRRPKNAPRTIDVDLLYLGEVTMADERLELPHPRLLQRRFVLTPLAAIRPDLLLPGATRCIGECLAGLDSDESIPALALAVW